MLKIYLANVKKLQNESSFIEKLDSVDENRKHKIKACKNQGDKVRSLGAGLILKYALEQEGIHSFTLQTTSFGKPYLTGKQAIHFSLSHSGEYVLCGISDTNIGVDIQIEKDKINYNSIAKRFFTEKEVDYIQENMLEEISEEEIFYRKELSKGNSQEKSIEKSIEKETNIANESRNRRRFLNVWAIKESYLKFCGEGLSKRLDSFEVEIGGQVIKDQSNNIVAEFWTDTRDNYLIAISQREISDKAFIFIEEIAII